MGRDSMATWWRWIVRPWRSFGLIAALIGSFAVPAFMAASADVFRVSAADEITRQVLDDRPTALDVTIAAEGLLAADGVAGLDDVARRLLDGVGRLSEPERTLWVSDPNLGLQRPPADDESPAEAIIGSGAKFVSRAGAVDALAIVDGHADARGVFISERMAERTELGAGSLVVINDAAPVPVAGVFANLWEGERDAYWDEVPAAFVPRFSRVLGGPLFEVIIVPEPVLYEVGLVGTAQWDTSIVDPPGTYDELVEYTSRLRGIERAFTETRDVVGAIAAFSGAGGARPALVTDAFDVRLDVDTERAELDQPIAAAAIGGIVLGLLVTAAGAAVAVRKHSGEVRLLRADGDAAWRFAVRAVAQFTLPAIVGATVGVAAAYVAIAVPGGRGGIATDAIDRGAIWRTALVGLAVAAVVTAASARNALGQRRPAFDGLGIAWVLPVVGLAVAAWVQVGAPARDGEVDPLVIAFPLVGLVAGVGVIAAAARQVMRRIHRSGRRLPPALFLAWRRVTAADAGAVLLSVAMGVALGLIIFSGTLVDSLRTAADAKAITAIGGRTQVVVDGRADAPMPDATTLVRVQTTRLTIGRQPVNVVAIDPATYVDGASWHPTFGSSPTEVLGQLRSPVDADVAVVLAGGFDAPDAGGFGTTNVASYEVVGRVASAPLASSVYPTLLVDADRLDEVFRRFQEAERPADVEPDEWAALYRSPLDRFRPIVVSQLDPASLETFADENDIRVREVITQADQRELVGNRAARWTFDYLGLLAVIAGFAAGGALLFYLTERRAARQLSAVMAARMGMRRSTAAWAAVGEIVGLVALAFAAGAATALALAARVFDRFEPDRLVPPDVGLLPPWSAIATIGGAGLAVVVIAALVSEWLASRRSYAEVLRGN